MSPSSFVWVIATSGRVFTLSTVGKRWKEVESTGGAELEFKRVSAHANCAWGIGCDHMLYTYVHSTDVPIVKREETYENQRWSPLSGYSGQLLPTDRPHWSDDSGLANKPKGSFKLPSDSWVWEPNASGDDGWALDATCDGVPTVEEEGWQYAVDFPAMYTPDMKFTSCVRRRRWVKFRRYIATDRWSKIPGLGSDSTEEPFIDVAVGGYDLPGRHAVGFRQVWAVTILGKVVYRHGVSTDSPEGTRWGVVPTQPGSEVLNLSVGPRGLVWAVTWDGNCLVRLGVGKEKEIGTYWDIVFPPDDCDHKFLQVAVGTDIVWAVARSGKIFYRTGIRAVMAPHEKDYAMGQEWVEMTGLMSSVSVGPDDHVWAIGLDDHLVYFRTGVTKDDPGGKMWKSIILPIMPKINFSSETNPLAMLACREGDERPRRDSSSSGKESYKEKKLNGSRDSGMDGGESRSNSPNSKRPFVKAKSKARLPPTKDLANGIPDIRVDSVNSSASDSSDKFEGLLGSEAESRRSRESHETPLPPELEMDPEWIWVSGTGCRLLSEGQTTLVTNWFSGHSLTVSRVVTTANSYYGDEIEEDERVEGVWRPALWLELEGRFRREVEPFAINKIYQQAIDRGVWIKKGTTNWWTDHRPLRWCESRIEVEQGTEQEIRVGTLTLYYKDTHSRRKDTLIAPMGTSSYQMYQHMKFRLEECICVTRISDDTGSNRPVLSLFTPKRLLSHRPLKLAFTTEQEFYDWLSCISGACNNLRQLPPSPSKCALWSTNLHGEIFTYESSSRAGNTKGSEAKQSDSFGYPSSFQAVDMYWRQIGGHLDRVESSSSGVVWGLGHDNKAYAYTGGTAVGNQAGSATSNKGVHLMVDTRKIYTYENQRWNPVSGFSDIGLPTDRPMWSDISGREERRREDLKLPNSQWKWVSEWEVDYSVTEGCDTEGWQYAADFPATYYDRQGLMSYVRRRRWTRSCRLTAYGPWKEIGGDHKIKDVSMQVDPSNGTSTITPFSSLTSNSSPSPVYGYSSSSSSTLLPRNCVDLWAVTVEGDVLMRQGVTSTRPEGVGWRHVAADQPFKCISVGEENCVWGVSQDGAAWFRSKITPSLPQGEAWIHVGKPGKEGLHQLSAGSTVVWAVDSRYQLWIRKDVTTITPGGTAWLFVSFNVKHVSCGFLNQTWIISNSLETPTHGSMYRRTGITSDSPAGVSWDKGIGIEWNHVTTRGSIPGLTPSPPHPPLTESPSSVLTLAGVNLRVSPSPEMRRKGVDAEDGGGHSFTSLTARRRLDARRESDDITYGLL